MPAEHGVHSLDTTFWLARIDEQHSVRAWPVPVDGGWAVPAAATTVAIVGRWNGEGEPRDVVSTVRLVGNDVRLLHESPAPPPLVAAAQPSVVGRGSVLYALDGASSTTIEIDALDG